MRLKMTQEACFLGIHVCTEHREWNDIEVSVNKSWIRR